MEIEYSAPTSVRDVIAAFGRTEDLSFAPNNRRLAIASYSGNRILLLDVRIVSDDTTCTVELTGAAELTSPTIDRPHGLAFVDDDTIVVANRGGAVTMLCVPGEAARMALGGHGAWPERATSLLHAPASVAVSRVNDGASDVLICNNGNHTVTRHRLERGAPDGVRASAVLLRKHLDIPDGVAISPDGRWIAVSNHSGHNVVVYENSAALNEHSEPVGMLRSLHYPHGLRFSADARHLFVADAGTPYIRVYESGADGWRGVFHAVVSVRAMPEAVFDRGHHNPTEGGPKGIALDASARVLAVTSESQPLAFLDLSAVMQQASSRSQAGGQRVMDINSELTILELNRRIATEAAVAQGAVRYMQRSRSWRITAGLRRLDSMLRGRQRPDVVR